MMTLSKQNDFTFTSLLEDIRGSKCCITKVRQYIFFLMRFFYHFQCFLNSYEYKLDHMHIKPHGIRTLSKHQL